MGDRHGGRFARRGRALSPPRRGFPMARCGFPMARGGGQDLPRARTLPTAKASRHGAPAKGFAPPRTLPTAKASRHGARAKEFAPRESAPHGEGLPTRRTSEKICPTRERSPRRRPPDTAHERKDLPRAGALPTAKASRHGAPAKDLPHAGTLYSAKASRHGARAKGFAPRRNALLGKGLPTRRTSERFAPRENALLGEGLPTRRTGERICLAQEHSPRRRPTDTAHERKNLPRGVRVRPTCRRTAGRPRPTNSRKNTPSAKASRHGARAKGFAPRENTPLGEGLPTRREGERICPAQEHAPRADEWRAALGRRTARKTPLRRGRTREGAAAAEFIHRKNKTTP